MTWDDIFRKFADCAEAAINPWSTDRIARVQEMAFSLETITDATSSSEWEAKTNRDNPTLPSQRRTLPSVHVITLTGSSA